MNYLWSKTKQVSYYQWIDKDSVVHPYRASFGSNPASCLLIGEREFNPRSREHFIDCDVTLTKLRFGRPLARLIEVGFQTKKDLYLCIFRAVVSEIVNFPFQYEKQSFQVDWSGFRCQAEVGSPFRWREINEILSLLCYFSSWKKIKFISLGVTFVA